MEVDVQAVDPPLRRPRAECHFYDKTAWSRFEQLCWPEGWKAGRLEY